VVRLGIRSAAAVVGVVVVVALVFLVAVRAGSLDRSGVDAGTAVEAEEGRLVVFGEAESIGVETVVEARRVSRRVVGCCCIAMRVVGGNEVVAAGMVFASVEVASFAPPRCLESTPPLPCLPALLRNLKVIQIPIQAKGPISES